MVRACLLLALFLAAVAAEGNKYLTKFDNVDVDQILNNERLYKQYFSCLKGGKCTPDGKELREALPDALSNGCSKCSEKQKAGSEKVIKHLLKHKPNDYAVLEKLYDPKGIYRVKYEEQLKKAGM